MRASFVFRVRVVAFIFFAVAMVLLVRLYLVQVVHGDEYRAKAEAQYVREDLSELDRGTIFFTPKEGVPFSAATLATGYILALNPTRIEDPGDAYNALATVLPGLDHDSFIAKASKEGDVYEELMRRVPEKEGKAIRELEVPGVELIRETWRFYPGTGLAAHVIGFLGYGADGTTIAGQYGLERSYDAALTRDGGDLYVNFFADLFTDLRSRFVTGETQAGADLVTSIEPSVQAHLEGVLASYNALWHARTVGGIVMDPTTGAVVAMAALPSFNNNDFQKASPASFSNPLVESVYEFGSTMKPLTMAAAIDAGAVSPTTVYDDRGFIVVDGARVSNFDGKGRGRVPMQEVLNQSLNTGIAFIVQSMGSATLRSYFEKYGLTEETGIDLPNEASPLIANFESPRMVEYVTAGFGQGIALSPIAMTRALATLANHGSVPGPHVGVELRYGGGIRREVGWSPPRQAISPESAETVTRMLVEVVDTALKGGSAKIPEYSVAAKTGTAQVARPDKRGYYDDRFLHSFFGYFPAYEPKFIVFFFSLEPVGARYASETWTDPFIDTVKFLTTYYDIPPDRAPL